MERFFRSLKTEWIPNAGYSSLNGLKREVVDYIIGYYNAFRPHDYNGGLTPNKSEYCYQTTS